MIFHPITTMSCIKLICFSFFLLIFPSFFLVSLSLKTHEIQQTSERREFLSDDDDDTLSWFTSVAILDSFYALAAISAVLLHVCNTRFLCCFLWSHSLLTNTNVFIQKKNFFSLLSSALFLTALTLISCFSTLVFYCPVVYHLKMFFMWIT